MGEINIDKIKSDAKEKAKHKTPAIKKLHEVFRKHSGELSRECFKRLRELDDLLWQEIGYKSKNLYGCDNPTREQHLYPDQRFFNPK